MNKKKKYPYNEKLISGNEITYHSKYNWTLSYYSYSISDKKINYSIRWDDKFPSLHREYLMKIFEILMHSDIKKEIVAINFYISLRYLYKYLIVSNRVDRWFCYFTETEWGSFIDWLKQQKGKNNKVLSIQTCRNYLNGIKSALRACEESNFLNINEEDVEALANVMKRKFRDSNRLVIDKNAECALNKEEIDNLYKIINEEWNIWKQNKSYITKEVDLISVVALVLAFDEGIRPEEINSMNIEDLNKETHELYLAPNNKPESVAILNKKTLEKLEALIKSGKETREKLNTNRVFVDYKKEKIVGTREINDRIRLLISRYSDRHPINRPELKISDGRKTLGEALAEETNNRESVKRVLRHKFNETAEKYYITQNKKKQSQNIYDSVGGYAQTLAKVYNNAVKDPEEEIECFEQIKQNNPDYENSYGICSKNIYKENKCKRSHCGNCPKLIPMTSKKDNWVAERDMYKKLAEKATKEKLKRQRLSHADLCQQYINLIDRRLSEE